MEPSVGSMPMAISAMACGVAISPHAAATARTLAVMSAVLVPNPQPGGEGVQTPSLPPPGRPVAERYLDTAICAFVRARGSTIPSDKDGSGMNSAHEKAFMGEVIRKYR